MDSHKLRIVLMGTGPFAVPTFEAIRASSDETLLVVTKPLAVELKRDKVQPHPVLQWAQSHGLPLFQPDSINEATSVEHLRSMKADLLVVCDYGQILSREALTASRLGGINLHGSLLPRHRGAAPVQWAILRGDQQSGISVIHMTPRLDGGPVIVTRAIDIDPHENAAELEVRLSQLGVAATLEALNQLRPLENLETVYGIGVVQSREKATPAPRLEKSDGRLNFAYPVELIDRQIRGLQPWPGAFGDVVFDNGKSLRVQLLKATIGRSDDLTTDHPPGEILWGSRLPERYSGKLAIVCRPGLLEVESLQPAGKKPQSAIEFLNGYGRMARMKFAPTDAPQALLERLLLNK